MHALKQAYRLSAGGFKSGSDPLTERLIKDAASSEDPKTRLEAVGRLRMNFDALIIVLVKSAHCDSAAEARRVYSESLDAKNIAIVNKCVAIFSDDNERRESAVLALRNYPEELDEVKRYSRFPGTRALAGSILSP